MTDHRPSLEELKPKTIDGLKGLAKRIKKRDGISHSQALEAAAQQAGFLAYQAARNALVEPQDHTEEVLPGSAFERLLRQ